MKTRISIHHLWRNPTSNPVIALNPSGYAELLSFNIAAIWRHVDIGYERYSAWGNPGYLSKMLQRKVRMEFEKRKDKWFTFLDPSDARWDQVTWKAPLLQGYWHFLGSNDAASKYKPAEFLVWTAKSFKRCLWALAVANSEGDVTKIRGFSSSSSLTTNRYDAWAWTNSIISCTTNAESGIFSGLTRIRQLVWRTTQKTWFILLGIGAHRANRVFKDAVYFGVTTIKLPFLMATN